MYQNSMVRRKEIDDLLHKNVLNDEDLAVLDAYEKSKFRKQ